MAESIQTRTVEARFYDDTPGHGPTLVVVAGTVYRREPDQEEARLALREAELVARFAADFGDEARDRLNAILDSITAQETHQLDVIVKRLTVALPTHAGIMRALVFPDDEMLSGEDWAWHSGCTLPPR